MPQIFVLRILSPEYFDYGTFTVTTPEPTDFALALSALTLLGLILAMGKRAPDGQSQAG